MKDNRMSFRTSQVARYVSAESRESLIIHSGGGLVTKSMRRVNPWFGWYFIACATSMSLCLWLLIW